MRIPNYRLHMLKGEMRGYWPVTVKANWRIIFRFEGEDVHEVCPPHTEDERGQ